jgi:hypothetical protein
MNEEEEVQLMIRAKNMCQHIPTDLRSKEYQEILMKINDFLLKHCQHEIVNDSIDINPDKSMDICYCVKCEITFE